MMSFCYMIADLFNLLLFKEDAWIAMPFVEVALWIGNPTADLSGGAEVSGGAYVRTITQPADWTGSANGAISNASPITFPTATAPWGLDPNPVSHVVLIGQSAVTINLFFGPLATSKEVGTGSIPKFATGDLDIAQI